ncbi:unnamed protein product, partial [Timema podura]|nr:unnamed protein product [Timema podura]
MQQEFAQFQHQQQQQQAHQQQQHNQQQQQINNMTLHPGHLQAVSIGQPGLVTLQAQPQELVQQSGLVATSISLPVVSNVSGVFTSHMPQGAVAPNPGGRSHPLPGVGGMEALPREGRTI